MRARAQDRGLPIPAFVHVLNHARVAEYMRTVPGPWMLKPRAEASAVGIKKIDNPEQLWPLLEQLGDKQSNYLLEKMIPGDVYHVDGMVWDKKLVFAEAHKYRRPILEVTQSGGIFATLTVQRDSAEWKELVDLTQRVVEEFGLVRGVTHTEIIRGKEDGKLYFLETAARVGGANISDLVEASTGVNLWEEWARIEISQGEKPYAPPPARKDYAGLVVSLARQETPDTTQFNDPEVVWRLDEKKFHIGLIVKSPKRERVDQLIESYIPRILRDYHAALPAPDKPTS
jgi:biotin carboxylase